MRQSVLEKHIRWNANHGRATVLHSDPRQESDCFQAPEMVFRVVSFPSLYNLIFIFLYFIWPSFAAPECFRSAVLIAAGREFHADTGQQFEVRA